MLVLTRRVNELIKVGDNVTVKVCGVNGNQVKIGIIAPRDIDIVRDNCKKDRDKNIIVRGSKEKTEEVK